jgi:broad specificity phosphatase PhoE
MKKIFFIRHGESDDNIRNVESRDTTELSPQGERQATSLAERFTNLPLDHIVSSSLNRAQQTGAIIGKRNNVSVKTSDLFVERRVTSEMYGKSFDSAEFRDQYAILAKNYFIAGARLADEETFEDIKERAKKAVTHLEKSESESIAVVTHGMFLAMLIAYITFGETVSPREFTQIFSTFKSSNTGLTLCEFFPESKAWKIITWNDQAHLG